ncbi:MAG: hypothetical protein LBT25_05065 [Candidatus Symbiothrix sp.]|jgi:fucose 4-O-acetylase-like acetyltransferase|nr:hypothetical protein [Candidatus Symbiothrix sp.]
MTKSRIVWVDYAKLMGMYLIIVVHLPQVNEQLNFWITSFGIALFFFTSSLLDKGEPVGETFRKGFKSLMIPYFCFYLITYTWWLFAIYPYISEYYGGASVFTAYIKPFIGMLVGEVAIMSYSLSSNVVLWFIPALFVTKLIFSFLLSIGKKKYLALILFNLFTIGFTYFFPLANCNLPFNLDNICMVFPFYTLGYVSKEYILNVNFGKIGNLALVIFCVSVGWILSQQNGFVDVCKFSYANNIFLFYINNILGIAGIIFLAKLFSVYANKFLLYMAQNTIIILAFQGPFRILTTILYQVIVGQSPISVEIKFTWYETLIISTMTLFACLIPMYIINRYFLFMLGRTKKLSLSAAEK